MLFISDTQEALEAAVDLVNTLPSGSDPDALATADDVERFLETHPYTGRITHDERERAALRGIRSRIAELWDVERDDAVPLVNAMLRDGRALPQLAIHDGYDWHVHATDPEAPLATRILVETGMAFVDVIRADQYARIRRCSADDCDRAYIDFSKNGSKRYCDTGNCGNRMNVNAYRRRRARENS